MKRKTEVSDFTFRQALQGNIDLSSLPFDIARQIQAFMRRMQRRMDRYNKREAKHAAYAMAGLNGDRAVARRRRQIAAGSLRP